MRKTKTSLQAEDLPTGSAVAKKSRPELFNDFCKYSNYSMDSWDIDPMYPVLKTYFYEIDKLDRETALWRTLLYVTFYHIGSAERVWTAFSKPEHLPLGFVNQDAFPTGIERRRFRANTDLALKFVNDMMHAAKGDLVAWVEDATNEGGETGWQTVREKWSKSGVQQAGDWSSYKWADLLKNVHGYEITAPDVGTGGNRLMAGPIPAMVRLTNRSWNDCATDLTIQNNLYEAAVDNGVRYDGLDQMETCLCDFNSLCRGSYYVGNDIDMQMEHFKHLPQTHGLWQARLRVFKSKYLGELHGWWGVRKDLKSIYRDTGVIIH